MSDKDFNPWWKRPNDFQQFDERNEFIRGAMGYRPNNKQEAMFGMMIAGYTNQKFDTPQAIGKTSNDSKP